MPARRANRLTPEVHQTIVAYLRAGGYPHVAAEAAGIPYRVFRGWLRTGSRGDSAKRYRAFARDVVQAIAQTRLLAESEVFKHDKRTWLRNGPGKEAEQIPGWSNPPRAEGRAPWEQGPTDLLRSPEVLDLIRRLRTALEPFPEARDAVLDQLNPPPAP